MIRFAIAALFSISLIGSAIANDEAAGSTVELIRISDGHLGAGVQIRPGLILTAAHVVSNDSTVTIKDDKGRLQTGTVISIDVNVDVAFVTLPDSDKVPVSPVSCDLPTVGLPVTMIGHPYGHTFVHVDGHILSGMKTSVAPWPDLILIDQAAYPGMSGGPVIAADGTVVALVVASTDDADGSPGPAGAVPDSVICPEIPTIRAAL